MTAGILKISLIPPTLLLLIGPFAGIGFFQDWAYAMGSARNAFIGSLDDSGVRSSSWLIRESIEFQRRLEAYVAGLDPRITPLLEECMMYRVQGDHRQEVTEGDVSHDYYDFIRAVRRRPEYENNNKKDSKSKDDDDEGNDNSVATKTS